MSSPSRVTGSTTTPPTNYTDASVRTGSNWKELSWGQLTQAEQDLWKQLGWTQAKWDGTDVQKKAQIELSKQRIENARRLAATYESGGDSATASLLQHGFGLTKAAAERFTRDVLPKIAVLGTGMSIAQAGPGMEKVKTAVTAFATNGLGAALTLGVSTGVSAAVGLVPGILVGIWNAYATAKVKGQERDNLAQRIQDGTIDPNR